MDAQFSGPLSHAEMVEALNQGRWDRTRVDARIARSWSRSARHRVEPGNMAAPQVLTAPGVREQRQPLEPLLHLARGAVDNLFRQVRDAGYVVMLANPDGVTIDFRNNLPLERELRQAGLYLGGCWPEGVEGTNAIGACAVDQLPITVHHAEHFRKPNSTLTCSAAPLRSETGELLGVLDVSALHSAPDRRSQLLVLQLVSAAARSIEDAWFLQRFQRDWVLRLGQSREFLEVGTEGLIALDGGGRLLAANERACRALGEDRRNLLGRPLEELLDTPFARLVEAAAGSRVLHWSRRSGDWYGLVRSPQRPARPAAAPPPRRTEAAQLAGLAGGDPQMRDSVARARRVLDKGIAVLLQGETGTGKELFARAFHEASSRAGAPFVALNCAAVPEALIESELFGYREGAFTGARAKGLRGKIVQANGGTLFLDEIGDMPLALQARLLRVLSERELTPLAAEQPVQVDLQLICATHRDLAGMVESGAFRQDLYFRLNGITIHLPPLRERADREALLDHLLCEEARAMQHAFCELDDEARRQLLAYPWPGNLRQLRHTLRSALALSEGGRIGLQQLPPEVRQARALQPAPALPMAAGAAPGDELLQALQISRWNITEAARLLGLSRATVYRRMARRGIVQPNHRS